MHSVSGLKTSGLANPTEPTMGGESNAITPEASSAKAVAYGKGAHSTLLTQFTLAGDETKDDEEAFDCWVRRLERYIQSWRHRVSKRSYFNWNCN